MSSSSKTNETRKSTLLSDPGAIAPRESAGSEAMDSFSEEGGEIREGHGDSGEEDFTSGTVAHPRRDQQLIDRSVQDIATVKRKHTSTTAEQ